MYGGYVGVIEYMCCIGSRRVWASGFGVEGLGSGAQGFPSSSNSGIYFESDRCSSEYFLNVRESWISDIVRG